MKNLSLLLLLSAVPLVSAQSLAGHHGGCCDNCGCHCHTRKVCRWEWEEKEVKEVVWKCECEDFCIPGPSPHCRVDECEECCNDCCDDCCGGHCEKHIGGCLCHKKKWGLPCGCCVRTKKILIRTEEVKKIKIPKCIIEEVCDRCCGNGGCGNGACANGACASGACADGVMPPPGVPMDAPTVAPSSDAPMPPMPPQAGKQNTRKKPNPLLSAFMPASR